MKDILKALEPTFGAENKGYGIGRGNHDLGWWYDKHDGRYETA
jgi:hypothetical protein